MFSPKESPSIWLFMEVSLLRKKRDRYTFPYPQGQRRCKLAPCGSWPLAGNKSRVEGKSLWRQGARHWTLIHFSVFASWKMLRMRPHCKPPWMPWIKSLKSCLRSTGWIQSLFQRYVTWELGNKGEEVFFLGALPSYVGQDTVTSVAEAVQ